MRLPSASPVPTPASLDCWLLERFAGDHERLFHELSFFCSDWVVLAGVVEMTDLRNRLAFSRVDASLRLMDSRLRGVVSCARIGVRTCKPSLSLRWGLLDSL